MVMFALVWNERREKEKKIEDDDLTEKTKEKLWQDLQLVLTYLKLGDEEGHEKSFQVQPSF